MKFKLLLLCFLFVALHAFSQTGRTKRALKALDKQNLEKAEKLLYKSLTKDSINTAANYGLSLLFIADDYDAYNIDVSYNHINLAIQQYGLLEEGEKLIKKLSKLGIVDSTLQNQKKTVEELAFNHVLQTNTIEAYDYYIQEYKDASHVAEAIRLRNEIAYQDARKENTYDAYKYFIDTYPNAVQIAEASELYEFLLYENKTKTRTLNSYISFLKEHPNTNYTADALGNIFELYTVDHKPASYTKFIRDFPQNNTITRKAIAYLFHQIKGKEGIEYFINNYSEYINDSLRVIIDHENKTIFPIIENGVYGFKDNSGEVVIRPKYDAISEDYLCGEIPNDFLEVLEGGGKLLISHTGEVIWSDNLGIVNALDQGLILNQKSGKYNVLHVAGFPVTTTAYDTIALLDDQYIKYGIGDNWGLLSFTGRQITRPQYDDIFMEGEFIIFEKYDKLGIANDSLLASFANLGNDEIHFLYDDLELLSRDELLAYKGQEQTVINKDLEEIIPRKNQIIYKLNEGWLIKEDDKFRFFSGEMLPISNEGYDSAYFKGNWLALKKADKWALLDQRLNTFPVFQYDSLKLAGNYFAVGKKADSILLVFQNGERKLLSKGNQYRVASTLNYKENQGAEIFIVNNSNNYKTLFNQYGKQILTGQYSDITMLGKNYIVLDKYNRKGLADTTGNILLPLIYDGIGNYSEEYIITLKNQKFGMFHKERKIDISPQYDVILKNYNDSLYIASKNRSLGVIDHENNEILPFKFDEITYWNDSVALVKESNQYHLYNIKTKVPVLEGITDLKHIGNVEESINKQAIILKDNNYGVITSKSIDLLAPVFDDIYTLGNEVNPIYFAEKRVKEAGLYVVIYYNDKGEAIHKQTFTEDIYDQIYCN